MRAGTLTNDLAGGNPPEFENERPLPYHVVWRAPQATDQRRSTQENLAGDGRVQRRYAGCAAAADTGGARIGFLAGASLVASRDPPERDFIPA